MCKTRRLRLLSDCREKSYLNAYQFTCTLLFLSTDGNYIHIRENNLVLSILPNLSMVANSYRNELAPLAAAKIKSCCML